MEEFIRGYEIKPFARPGVKVVGNGITLLLRYSPHAISFRSVLTNKAISVLIIAMHQE